MNPLRTVMPTIVAHEGIWDGVYRHIDANGTSLDEHRTWTSCEFPDDGDDHYIQHNRLSWTDGRTAEYRFGCRWSDGLLRWDTDRFHGVGWETDGGVLMLRLERRDVPGAYYVEMINLAPDRRTRARTWQWFRDGKPWKRTLCDEWRIG
ncbi:hypothetical protein [Sphingomonas sp.]|jgi:hypothetical protein|uniref:hypothetical protein n=1 Tax=Sphingomonas sp. TaxID=28214 RepID=UPI002DE83C3A|nr:hypothetical protein [Sphingomonas sp.]